MKYDVNTRNFDRIPQEMRDAKRWVCWTADKTPINVATGRGASSTNPQTWATFQAACGYIGRDATYKANSGEMVTMPTLGVGFVLGDGWAGVDLDGGDSHGAAAVPAHVLGDFANTLGTYCEYSKSGEGFHLIGRYSGDKLQDTRRDCVEIYLGGRYFAITGNIYNDHDNVADITASLPQLHEKYIAAPIRKEQQRRAADAAARAPKHTSDNDREEFLEKNIDDILAAIPADDRDLWVAVGMALKAEGFDITTYDAWSRTSGKYKGFGDVEKRWRSFGRRDGYNGGYLIRKAQENGWKPKHLTGEYAQPMKKATYEQKPAPAPAAPAQLTTDKPTESKKDNAKTMIDAFMATIQSRQYEVMPTGFEPLDRIIGGGFMRQTLVMLGAAPGMGKSCLTAQVFESMAQQGHNVLYYNLEMSREQMLARSFSRIARERDNARMAALDVLQGFNWTSHQRNIMQRTADYYTANIAPHMVYNPGDGHAELDVIYGEVIKAADRAKAEGRPAPIVVIDYLHLLRGQQREDTSVVVKRAVDLFKGYAIKYNSLVFCILAFGRASNKRGQVSQESGRDTSAIEYSADLMLGLNFARVEDANTTDDDEINKMREEEKAKPESIYRLKVLKSRLQGGCGSVDIKFSGKYGLFYETTDVKTGMERVDADLPDAFTTRASDMFKRK